MHGEATPLLPIGAHVEKKEDENHEPVIKEIDHIGSFTLLINNMVGPAMLGIPRLFQQAGLIPTSCCIIFIYACATLCGTLFSDAISAIPGNKTFDRHVDFSTAFRLIIGMEFYVIAETLFLITCVVQAVAAIVESAQSVDGFLASFLIGRTYALQLSPSVEFISWTPELCFKDESNTIDGDVPSSETQDCTPFSDAGSLVITLGFLITTAIFLPLGRGLLKETIVVQLIAFSFMCLLLVQFSGEFVSKGFPHSLPLFGDSISQLAGVVLFNYAYIVTVPSWLSEKQNGVSVNSTIWHASTLSSAIYFGFGIMCAMTFSNLGGNALVMLASTKVHLFTRICAALFGVTIIGSGVPVFCVMIRTAIYHSGACSYDLSLFLGSVAPYLLSWMLYQGSALMTVLNWTGLVVNGFVAFILPMYLVLRSMGSRHLLSRSHDSQEDIVLMTLSGPAARRSDGSSSNSNGTSPASDILYASSSNGADNSAGAQHARYDSVGTPASSGAGTGALSPLSDRSTEDSSVQPLPPFLEPLRYPIVVLMMVCFALIIGGTIGLDIYFGIQPEE